MTDRTAIPAEVNNFYDRTLLMRATPLLIHTKFAQVRDIPKNGGTDTIKFRRYSNLSAATTALTEGVTPVGSDLSVTAITAQVLNYGDYVTMTDKVLMETADPLLTEAAEILGDQAGDTLDQLCRDVINAGTNVYYSGTATERTGVVGTELITTTLLNKVIRLLKNNKARTITKQINASTGYSTDPVAASYIGIVHPNVSYTLTTLTGFTPVEKYPSNQGVMEGEIGKYKEIRFIETTNAKVFTGGGASGADVYSTLVFGANAYGISRISGEAMKNIVKALGSAGTADPLDQRSTSGWKAAFVAKILNNDFMVRIETGIAA